MKAGSTGHWPVPSGDSPDGTTARPRITRTFGFTSWLAVIPPGQWPGGTGESPVPPMRNASQWARWLAGLVLPLLVASGAAQAQPFTPDFSLNFTGTNDLVVTANTNIALPPDGVLQYRTITINSGTTLTFSNNALNTPVYLLARSNVLINGTIDVSGKPGNRTMPGDGGPGSFRGGYGAPLENPPVRGGDGKGPGGGGGLFSGGNGGNGTFAYGNALCAPLVGGSSGGGGGVFIGNNKPGGHGGGGGGAILVASGNWITNDGVIRAWGGIGGDPDPTSGVGRYIGGSGSGGAIRLVAPIVSGSGSGSLDVSSPNAGRIRIDSTDRIAALRVQMTPISATSATRGSQGFIFPQTNLLTITNLTVAGTSYPLNATNPFSVTLPPGPATNALVQITASGHFYGTNTVLINVAVTPDQGATTNYPAAISIVNDAGATNVPVTIPSGTTSTLHVWTP